MERVRELLRSEEGGGARALGGLLLATGILVLLFRRSEFADPWGELPIFLMLAATASFLYATGFWASRLSARTLAWQTVFVVFGLILIPFALFAFVDWVGGNTDAPLNTAWIFLATAVAGLAAALVGGVRFGCLAAGISLIVSWLGLWDELLDDGLGGDLGTLRGLLIVVALILLVIAMMVAVRGRPEGGGSDLITAAGIAAVVAAGVLTVGVGLGALIVPVGIATTPSVDTSLFWDAVLLISSLGLLAYGSVSGFRGPAYVGAVGLALFIFIVGNDLDDSSPAGKVVGWPLILLLAAAALLVWSLLPALRRTPD